MPTTPTSTSLDPIRTEAPPMPIHRSWHRPGAALLVALTLVIAAACSSSPSTPTATPATTTTTAAAAAAPAACANPEINPVTSYEPTGALPRPGAMPAGTYMATIQQRGRLVVGASADTYRMGARNPFTGDIEGFDIDRLKEVARAIFGEGGEKLIEFKIVTYAQRIPALVAGDVDIVAHSMTINCVRWQQIDFSSQYYTAGQKVLVASDSDVKRIEDLGGARVCTQKGTTSIERLAQYPEIVIVPVDDVSDCVVKFQVGEADAISGDDTVLAGFAAQDPYAKVAGEAFSSEPYGMGIAKGHPEFVRFVNAVLEQSRTDGSWQRSYDQWLRTGPDDTQTPPAAVYGRTP